MAPPDASSTDGTTRTDRTPGRFHRLAHSRGLKIFTGLLLLVSGVAELFEAYLEDLHEVLQPAHALIVFGFVFAAQGMAEILEGVEELAE